MLSFLLSLRHEAVARRDGGVQGGVSLGMLAGRIGLDGPETEDLDPAAEARHDCNDVGRIHVGSSRRCRPGRLGDVGYSAGAPAYRIFDIGSLGVAGVLGRSPEPP